jgi:hypothetical protein
MIPSATFRGALDRTEERSIAEGSHAVKMAKYKKMTTPDNAARGYEIFSRLMDTGLLRIRHIIIPY